MLEHRVRMIKRNFRFIKPNLKDARLVGYLQSSSGQNK
jgi:hypothetical protein